LKFKLRSIIVFEKSLKELNLGWKLKFQPFLFLTKDDMIFERR